MPEGLRPEHAEIGWIGRALRRVEDDRLLRGEGQFLDDLARPGCLFLAVVRSAHAHADLVAVDGRAAASMAGVVAVITAADLGALETAAVNPLVPGLRALPFEVLARQTVQAVGQPVAAIVAETFAAAQDAAERVEVQYAPRAPILPGDPAATPALSQNWRAGDVEAAFRSAAHVVRLRVQHARVAAMPLEPRHALADWNAATGHLSVWLPTQTPHRARQDLAAILGIDAARIRVVAPDVGGAFGAKASIYPEDVLVAWAARRLGQPVRWRGSRGEDLLAGTHGRGGTLAGELALGADGALLALRADLAFPLGHWMPFSAAVPGRNAARILPGPYHVPAVDITLRAAPDNTAPMGIYRGAGRPEAAMLMERLMDEAARILGSDPVALRRRNLVPAAALPFRSPTGETLESGDYARLLDRVAATADYARLRAQQAARRGAGAIVGIGVGLYVEPCGHGWESAAVRLACDGSIVAATGSTAQGQGRETAFAQIVADVLGVAPEFVSIRHGDTDETPPGIGALASRSTPIGGSALLRAAAALRDKATAAVARLLQVPPAAVVLRDGKFRLNSADDRGMDWPTLAAALAAEQPDGTDEAVLASLEVFHAGEAWSSGCCIAQLSIDADTGRPHLEALTHVDDAGIVVNPLLVEGQLLGGMAQGIGEALSERIVYDAQGQLLTGSLMDYAMPRAADMPAITLTSSDIPSPANALGARGVGEAGCIGTPAAIVNAVLDALAPFGVRHLDMPLTAEKIWRSLRAAQAREKDR